MKTEPEPPTADMRRSTSTIMVGTLAGNGVAWLLNFALARIFTEETFGIAAVLIAVTVSLLCADAYVRSRRAN